MFAARFVLCLSPFLFLSPAYAIPPPDIIASVWQSVLQIIGVAAVFVTGAVYALRQWLEHYLGRWQKPVLYSLFLLTVLLIIGVLFIPVSKAESGLLQPERLAIKTIINQEKDGWLRDWKLQTLNQMERQANSTRQRKGLATVNFATVASFTPKALYRNLQQHPEKFYLLDIREASERSKFRIRHQGESRFGDMVQGVMPDLPEGKIVVVLCHSGLRGYLGAYFLQQAGTNEVAFLRGGLASWHKQGLPVAGKADFKAKKRHLFSKKQTIASTAVKVQVDPEGTTPVALNNLLRLPYETASSSELEAVLKQLTTRPYLLVCKTYGGCFHATNMAWLIEQRGGKVAGIYDESGEHAKYIQQ
ncbi:MAG: rhodanese-like domain-containing protein [Thiolinea sp.]